MKYYFRTAPVLEPGSKDPLGPDWPIFQARANFVHDAEGVHLWCRNGAGAGFQLQRPRQYGTWLVRSRISASPHDPATKKCLLLWGEGGGWQTFFREIDFDESGDRGMSYQTEHYAPKNSMHHTGYPMDQTVYRTTGVKIDEDTISYLCNGKVRAAVQNEHPGVLWNIHFRTQPNLDTENDTVLDIRWVEVPD